MRVEQKLGRIIACVSSSLPPGAAGRVGPHIPFGITKHSSTVPTLVLCLPDPSILHEGPLHYFLFFLACPHNQTPLHLVKLALI